jgi:hypothetical protein
MLQMLKQDHLGNASMTISILILDEAKRRNLFKKKAK